MNTYDENNYGQILFVSEIIPKMKITMFQYFWDAVCPHTSWIFNNVWDIDHFTIFQLRDMIINKKTVNIEIKYIEKPFLCESNFNLTLIEWQNNLKLPCYGKIQIETFFLSSSNTS